MECMHPALQYLRFDDARCESGGCAARVYSQTRLMHGTDMSRQSIQGMYQVLDILQGMDDTEVAAMGYAELNEGISPTSALEVCAQPAGTSQCPVVKGPQQPIF